MGIYYLVAFPRTREFLYPGRLKGHGVKQFDMIHGEIAKLAMMMATRGSGPIFVVSDSVDAYTAVKSSFEDVTIEAVRDFNEMFRLDSPMELELDQESWDYKHPPYKGAEEELRREFGACLWGGK